MSTVPTIEFLGTSPAHGGPTDSTHLSVTLSVVDANYLVLVITYDGGRTISNVAGVGSAWEQLFRINSGGSFYIEVWTSPVTGPVTDGAITAEISGFDSVGIGAFGVIGVNSPPTFDLGGGTLPAFGGNSVTYNLSSPYSTLIALQGQLAYTAGTAPTAFSPIYTSSDQAIAFGAQGLNQVEVWAYYQSPGYTLNNVTTESGTPGEPDPLMVMLAFAGAGTIVPNVIGMLDGTAQTAITNAGLDVGTVTTQPSDEPITSVLSQSLEAGTFASYGSSVDLVESAGVIVPDLTNLSLSVNVPAALEPVGLVVGIVTYEPSGTVLSGNVISQSPAAGSYASFGSGVNVLVSSGLPALVVPDLFGKTQSQATSILLDLGLAVGAIGSAPSQFVPAGEVMAQAPSPGPAVAVGTIVSFVISTGVPVAGTTFDFEATVISQYANSPTIMQLVQNLNEYIDQSANFAEFFSYVWNVDTAVGFGLDIWGKIVNVQRLLNIPNTTDYVGFYQSTETQPDQDWQPMGSDQPPQPAVGGAMYTGYNATTAYLLPDDAYRQLILAKAFANICTTTAPAINQILQNLYGVGSAWVLNTGPMAISYNLNFTPTAIQLAILEQSGVIPTPPGVAVTINTGV